MAHEFDHDFWEQHWQQRGSMGSSPPNPYLARELGDLPPGTALDAGCGAGAEAIWLAAHGWQVTAADISAGALARAADRAAASTAAERIHFVEADLGVWSPGTRFDLVTTHYAHPAMPQLEFYDRIADWVALGGTLLVVGHTGSHHPPEAAATAAGITERLGSGWDVVTAAEPPRPVPGRAEPLHDVVVRAVRRS
jgi:SAM-dependent methyltransferase